MDLCVFLCLTGTNPGSPEGAVKLDLEELLAMNCFRDISRNTSGIARDLSPCWNRVPGPSGEDLSDGLSLLRHVCREFPRHSECVAEDVGHLAVCDNDDFKESVGNLLNIRQGFGDFVCADEGDKISLFVAEGGPECLHMMEGHIRTCLSDTIGGSSTMSDVMAMLLHEGGCRIMYAFKVCVVAALQECPQPTTANLVDTLIHRVLASTTCHALFGESPRVAAALLLPLIGTVILSLL